MAAPRAYVPMVDGNPYEIEHRGTRRLLGFPTLTSAKQALEEDELIDPGAAMLEIAEYVLAPDLVQASRSGYTISVSMAQKPLKLHVVGE